MALLKKFIGDKAFYKTTLAVAVPIMVQNFITNFVSMLDNLMVGNLGTEQMSGVSIINQLIFVFSLALFGALSGAGIFTAQFYGKEDAEGIRHTVRYKIAITLLLLGAGILIFLLFDDALINLFLHESDGSGDIGLTLVYAKKYLKIILWGLLPFCISQIVSSTLRETGETVAPMVAGFIAVLTNCAFNWVLIFGKLGFPELGLEGAAYATFAARIFEVIFVSIYALFVDKRIPLMPKKLLRPGKIIAKDYIKYATPVVINETLWSFGYSMYAVVFGHMQDAADIVAAYSITGSQGMQSRLQKGLAGQLQRVNSPAFSRDRRKYRKVIS